MKQSAQAIVVDRQGKIYLEDNAVTNMLSFIWWKLEEWEKFITTVIREVEEELGLFLPENRFLDKQEQPVRRFWNARIEKYIEWYSEYFVLVLWLDEVKAIKRSVKLIILGSITELETFPEEKFWPLGRDVFKTQVQRALSHIS